jgi:glycosyltransferase involved in cell wall biosynthesis
MAKEKLKIVFLSFYSGEVYRGVEIYVHNLANEFNKLGHDVTVFQNGPKARNSAYKTVSINLKIDWNKKSSEGKSKIPFIDYWANIIASFTKRALSQLPEDMDILIPTNGSLQSLYSKVWTMRHKAKLIISGQSGLGWDDRWNTWMFPNTFVGLTAYQTRWAKKANPFVKVVTIPNGVDYNKFANENEIHHFELPRPIVLSAGALVDIKRHECTIKAIAGLNKGSLVLVGKGELFDQLKDLGNKLLPGRFAILDVNHADMPKIYKAADVFAFATSAWESFGIVLLEAMAAGLPVVATDDPIRREIVGNSGIFVDPIRTKSYTRAIKDVLSKKWGQIPQQQAKKFDWDTIAQKYQDLFYKIL